MNPRPRLASLIFEVTQRCNHVCLHCYNVWQGESIPSYPRGELDTTRVFKVREGKVTANDGKVRFQLGLE